MVASVLLVSADASVIDNVRQAVTSVSGCRLDVVGTCNGSGRLGNGRDSDLVFFHLAAPEAESQMLALLASTSVSGKPMTVIAISDMHDVAQGVKLLRRGAADYLGRPLSLGRIAMLTDILTAKTRFGQAAANGSTSEASVSILGTGGSFLYCSEQMTRLVEDARTVAPLETTVLLYGETGTGKTRLARLIHELSPRRLEPFMAVHCGALSTSLIESELFGHVKGAFTGADRDREGKCAAAGVGTLMLDDIDALSPSTQSKLLRAVDERVFEPVGSNHTQPLGARIIVATNQCLEREIAEGRFRADLYYRINVVTLHLPPLRERAALIEPLARQILTEFGLRGRDRPWGISSEALAALQAHNWPGNIRELRNVLERAVALGRGNQCELCDLPDCFQRPMAVAPQSPHHNDSPSRWLISKLDSEAKVIGDALAQCGNNRSLAARELGISRVTFYKMLHKHGFI